MTRALVCLWLAAVASVRFEAFEVLPGGFRDPLAAGCAAALSGDGTVVAFATLGRLLPEDVNDDSDIYLYERGTGAIELVSREPTGRAAGASRCPHLSADGSLVVFESNAVGRMQGEATDSLSDIYLLTRATGRMRRVTSVTWDWARRPRLSGDGRFVVFQARLVAESETFVYRQPVDNAATQPTRVARGFDAAVNEDGSVIAYTTPWHGGKPLGLSVWRDGATGQLAQPPRGVPDGPSHSVALSGDGRWVAYVSSARRLLPGRTLSGRGQIYVEDTATGARQLVSAGPDGREGNGHSLHPAIDESGSHVVYETNASDLAGRCSSSRRIGHATCVDDINLGADIVHWTRATGVVRRVTPDDEDIWLDPSVLPTVSGDGRQVGFLSRHPASALDGRSTFDLFLTRLHRGE